MTHTRVLATLMATLVMTAAGALAGLYPAPAAAADVTAEPGAVNALFGATLPDPAGHAQPLAALRGKPLVLNFWASWCGPCVKEMPELSALHRAYAPRGVQFAGIGIDSAQNVQRFLQTVKVDYPLYIAGFGGSEMARRFGDSQGALPFTVLIDGHGKIRYVKLGAVEPAELRNALDAL